MTTKAEHNRKMMHDEPSLLSDDFQKYFMDVYENNNQDLEIAILNGIKKLEKQVIINQQNFDLALIEIDRLRAAMCEYIKTETDGLDLDNDEEIVQHFKSYLNR